MRPTSLLLPAAVASLALAPVPTARAQELIVSGYLSDAVHRYDYASGASLGSLPNVNGAHAAITGPDGLLYVAQEEDDQVVRFDPVTLANLGPFVWDDPITPQDETGGLDGPTALQFGEDGRLYVASFNTDSILRYDGTTGAFFDQFVAPASGGLNGPDAGMTFGPDGHLYVPSYWNHAVLRYDGATGAFVDTFVAAGAGGLSNPRTLRFRSDGVLYVSGEGSGGVHRYDRSGAVIDKLVTLQAATGFVISPFDGDLYVSSLSRDLVAQFDGATGTRVRTLVKAGDGGLDGPVFVSWLVDPELRMSRIAPGVAGVSNTLSMRNATPNGLLFLVIGSQPGSLPLGGCPWLLLGIGDPQPFLVAADSAGAWTMSDAIDPSLSGVALLLQGFDVASCRLSNLVEQTLQ